MIYWNARAQGVSFPTDERGGGMTTQNPTTTSSPQ